MVSVHDAGGFRCHDVDAAYRSRPMVDIYVADVMFDVLSGKTPTSGLVQIDVRGYCLVFVMTKAYSDFSEV